MTVFLSHPIPRETLSCTGSSCDTFLCNRSHCLSFSMKSLPFLPHRWIYLPRDLIEPHTCRVFSQPIAERDTFSTKIRTKVPLTYTGNSRVQPSSEVLSNDSCLSFNSPQSACFCHDPVSPPPGIAWGSAEPRTRFFCWSLVCSLPCTQPFHLHYSLYCVWCQDDLFGIGMDFAFAWCLDWHFYWLQQTKEARRAEGKVKPATIYVPV